MKVRLFIGAAIFACLATAPSRLLGQASIAVLTYPPSGGVVSDLSQLFAWTAISGAQAYYLYVGSTPGAKDVADSGEIQQTTYAVSHLPIGHTAYARLWTKTANVWHYTDSNFSVQPLFATITNPVSGSDSVDLAQPIQWTSVANAQAYYLYVGTTVGAKDLLDTRETLATSYTASSLPSGQTLYARLWTLIGGAWWFSDSTLSAMRATVTYPINGSMNADVSQPLRWFPVPNAQAYHLTLGTTAGASDLLDTGEMTQTSASMATVPVGQIIYAHLGTKMAGVWHYADSSFGTLVAALTNPPGASTNLMDLSYPQQLRWTSVPNAEAYYLYVGTTPGAGDFVNTGEIQQTSYSQGLLGARFVLTVYIRLWTKVGGIWRYIDRAFGFHLATLTYPPDGSTAVDLSQQFQWITAPSAVGYYLYVGTTPGAKDLVDTGEIHTPTYSMHAVPSGQTMYVRLWTHATAFGWQYTDSSFSARATSLTSPLTGATNVDVAQPMRWFSVPGVQAYYLYLGRSVGAKDLLDSGETQQTSYQAKHLPGGQTVYARLWTKMAGAWRYTDSNWTTALLAATVTSAADGATNVDLTQQIQWTPVPNAQAYYVYIGRTAGAKDLVDSGETQQTFYLATHLPSGQPLYLRLWTKMAGVWRFTDSTFVGR